MSNLVYVSCLLIVTIQNIELA